MSQAFQHGPLNFRMMSPVIRGLIIVNVTVFVLSLLVGGQFSSLFGLIPQKVIHDRWVWQPFTYLFLHASFFHILFNLFALWMFGMAVESQWGSREFLKYYLVCGIGAGIANVLLEPNSHSIIIGASGAVYGLLVAFAMLYPDAVVYLYFFFPIKAKHMALLFGLIEFFGTTSPGSGIARFAHLSGMVIGYFYIRWWWVTKLRARALYESLRSSEDTPSSGPVRSRSRGATMERSPGDEMAEVDRILDKILEKGEGALTDREREILHRHSKQGPEGHA